MNHKLTILIVEDDLNDVALFRVALRTNKIDDPLQIVPDGQEAMDYLTGAGHYADRERFPLPGVIFTDLRIPRVGGLQVLKWVRSHPEFQAIPVIILTSSRFEADVREAYRLGANGYLVKPTDYHELQAMVKTTYEFWAWCEQPKMPAKTCLLS